MKAGEHGLATLYHDEALSADYPCEGMTSRRPEGT